MIKKIGNKQNFEQGALILLLAALLSKLISALFKIPLSSNFCLGDLGFGYFSAAYDLISPIILLSVSGLPVAVSKLISEYNIRENGSEINKVFHISRRLFLLVGIAMSFASAVLILVIAVTNGWSDGYFCFLAIIPTLIFSALASAYRGYFEGVENMLPPALSSLVEALCKLILGFGFALVTVKATANVALAAAAALSGITLGGFFSCLYLHIRFKKGENISRLCKTEAYDNLNLIKSVALIALPIALYSFSGSVVGLIDSITVRWQLSNLLSADYDNFKNMFSEAFGELGTDIKDTVIPTFLYGIRSKAYTLYNIVPTLTVFLGVSAVPHITKAVKEGDSLLVEKNCLKAIKLSLFCSFPAGIGLAALCKEIMYLLYGKSASSDVAGKLLFIFGIAAAFSGAALVMGNVLQGLGKQNKALLNVGCGVLAKIILNLILCSVPSINIYGSAFSTAACFIIIFVLNLFSLRKALGKTFPIYITVIKLLSCSLLCGLTAFLVALIGENVLITIFAILSAVAVYMLLVVVFKVFKPAEIKEIPLVSKIIAPFL
ncbi:MAG: oligosaccharide flippase family protein [Acutalibacteraceae bacterium]|nr:oligosaccharide flippase family protein [Acutalibacteraceae bacterium]